MVMSDDADRWIRFHSEYNCVKTMSITDSLRVILQRIATAAAASPRQTARSVRLVAVSKTQPISAIREAYDAGQREFGENYIVELVEKATQLPDDIKWHFIGHIQKNKAKKLLSCRNLAVIETIDSEALADALQRLLNDSDRIIDAFIQVNTSNEDTKSGCEPGQASQLACHIISRCPNLRFKGLMTIGEADNTDCFSALWEIRRYVAQDIGLAEQDLELSMGMSGDFEKAIEFGSTSVRVGSAIFGARPAKPQV